MALDPQPLEAMILTKGPETVNLEKPKISSAARRVSDGAMAGLALALPLSIAISNLFWGVALLMVLVTLAVERPRFRWTGVELPWVAGIGIAVFSGLLSDRPAHSLWSLRSEILVVVFLLAAHTGEAPALRQRLSLFAVGATVAGGLGILQKGLGWSAGSTPAWAAVLPGKLVHLLCTWGGRAIGFYNHPITFAEMLLLAGALVLGLALVRLRPVWAASGAILFLAVLASGTRGVWMAMFITLSLWGFLRRDRKVLGVFLLLAALSALLVSVSPGLRGRTASIVNTKSDSSNRIRMGLYAKSLELVRDHPLVGVGPGNVVILPSELRWGGSPPDMTWTETHNMYLQSVVERGLPGLAVFLWLLAAVGRLLWRAARSGPPALGIFFGFVGLLFAGITETWTNDSEVVLCFYFLAGTAWALGSRAAPVQNSETKTIL
ncbi:MAG: O-antigen ligase family protein [Elusimicrobia bacterium]|nr:O-antigen ligase family protein [Elusimicrobiota bacterium]